ncbi:MAG: MFS transporter [Verrucomicrobiota bacterium]
MAAIRRQFFLSYAVLGSVMPLITVFLKEQGGFNFFQIGLAMSLMSLPMLFSPAFITLLADRHFDTRRILAIAYGCSSVVLSLIYLSDRVIFTLLLFIFHGLAFVPLLPLQDGYYFSLTEQRRKSGGRIVSYPLIRVWGTVGFIVPSLILFVPLSKGAAVGSILPCAVGFCLLCLLNSFSLPEVASRRSESSRLPTKAALQAIFGPNARWLSIGLFFGFLAAATFYAFIGNFLDEAVGIEKRYIGLIINIGVSLEIGFTLIMPWMQRRIHLKGILVLGLFCMMSRMILMAWFPVPAVAILSQVFHGLEVLALYVGPVMFLDRLAGDEFRNSIQGVFTMVIGGVARVVGAIIGGWVVWNFGLEAGFIYGGVMAGISFLILAFLFSRIPPRDERGENAVSGS